MLVKPWHGAPASPHVRPDAAEARGRRRARVGALPGLDAGRSSIQMIALVEADIAVLVTLLAGLEVG
jgi:hypothetical protein